MPAPPRTGQGLQPGSAAARRYANMARNLSQLQTQLASATGPQRDTIQRAITRIQGEMTALQRPGLAPAPPAPAPPAPDPAAPTGSGGIAPESVGDPIPPRPDRPGTPGNPDKRGGGGYNVGDLPPDPDKASGPQVTGGPNGGPQTGGPRTGAPPAHGVLFSLLSDPAFLAHVNQMLPQWARDQGVDAAGYIESLPRRPVSDGLSRWVLNQVNAKLQEQGYSPISDWSQSRGSGAGAPSPEPPGGGGPSGGDPDGGGGGGGGTGLGPRGQVAYGQGTGQYSGPSGPFIHPSMANVPAGVTPPPGAAAYRLGANGQHEFRIRGPAGSVWIPYQAPATPGGGNTDTPTVGPPLPPPPPGGWLPGGGMGPVVEAPQGGGGGSSTTDLPGGGMGPVVEAPQGGGMTNTPPISPNPQRYDPTRKPKPPMTNTPPIYVPPPPEEKFKGMGPIKPGQWNQAKAAQGGDLTGGRNGYPEGFSPPTPPGLDPEKIRLLQSRRRF